MRRFRSIGIDSIALSILRRLFVAAGMLASAGLTQAQTCWVYTDNQQALAPMKCVQKNNLALSCTCSPGPDNSCTNDCTSVLLPPGNQTIRQLHEAWHACFGPLGGTNPKPGRGNRWYAFHRQFELDFNAWRRTNGFAPIESLEWCPNMNMPIGTAPPGTPSASNACGTLTPRPANTLCPQCTAFPQCLFKPGAGPVACANAPLLLIARNGRIASFDALGFQERRSQTPMKNDSIFRIASMSKPITSVAIMILGGMRRMEGLG